MGTEHDDASGKVEVGLGMEKGEGVKKGQRRLRRR